MRNSCPSNTSIPTAVFERVDFWMRVKYGISLSDLKPTNQPGYWEAKHTDGFPYTYTYFDHYRDCGRFTSTTRSWKVIVDTLSGKRTGDAVGVS